MSRGAQRELSRTRGLKKPTYYVQALLGEFSEFAFDEERVLELKGQWRSLAFASNRDKAEGQSQEQRNLSSHSGAEDVSYPLFENHALDLEIGTGNGLHFAHRAINQPQRLLVGLELKYKPLIQAIRRALRAGAVNARMARYNAVYLDDIFAPDELNDVFIHFPDPWAKTEGHKKHRLIQDHFLERLYRLQKKGGAVFFKTDSRDYFDWAVEHFKQSSYQLVDECYDLHNSQFANDNFITHFESLFLKQGLPIYYLRAIKLSKMT